MKAFYMGVAGEFLISWTVRPRGSSAELSGASRADFAFSSGACRPKSLFFVSAFEVTEGILFLNTAMSCHTDQERVWEIGDCGPVASVLGTRGTGCLDVCVCRTLGDLCSAHDLKSISNPSAQPSIHT